MNINLKSALIVVLSVLVLSTSFILVLGQEEGEGETTYVLGEIRFSGNENISDQEILKQLELNEGDSVSQADLEKKIKKVKDMGEFKEVDSNVEVTDGEIRLKLTLEEYPVLEEIKFEGVSLLPPRKLRDVLNKAGVKKGEVINKKKLKKGLEKISKEYEKKGYPLISTGNVQIGKTLTIEIIEGELASVRVEGLQSIPQEAALEMIETSEGGPVELRNLRETYQNLQSSIYFTSVELVPARGYSKSDVILRWKLTERRIIDEPVEAGEIRLEDNTVFSDEQLAELTRRLPEGKITNYDVLRALAPVYDKYTSNDYSLVDFSFNEVRNKVLVLDILEGKIVELSIEGNTRTSGKVITNKLFLSEGDVYNNELMVDSRRRLLNLGYFSKVEPETEMTKDGVKLTVKIKEKNKLNSINGGLTWSEGGLGGKIKLSTKNIFGLGQDVSLNLSRGFAPDAKFDGSIDWKNTYYPSGFNFTKLSLYRNAGSNKGIKTSFGYPLSGNFSLEMGYNADWIIGGSDSKDSITHILSADLVYDDRDNPNFPTSGTRRSLKIEKAGDFAPGLSFAHLTLKNTYFQGLPEIDLAGEKKQTLALNLQLGVGLDTPANYQSEFTGKHSVRGLDFRRASNYAFLNGEYRLQLLRDSLYVTSFVDSGVDLSGSETFELRTSAGFEINLQLFGHLRIGAAWPFEEDFNYVPSFYFAMGRMF
ncbi:BamA/TamA family outer membrane protein [Candidatus Bipolaricaulota bacterium]|nr:BamA/TamA family outer membrane protein [Candidatus Bipolaricaulota bacterium]